MCRAMRNPLALFPLAGCRSRNLEFIGKLLLRKTHGFTDTRHIDGTERMFPRPSLFALMVFKGFM
jgi:hypothetical protein